VPKLGTTGLDSENMADNVKVNLQDKDIWNELHENRNEMKISKNGK
jgi:hypothetical protein